MSRSDSPPPPNDDQQSLALSAALFSKLSLAASNNTATSDTPAEKARPHAPPLAAPQPQSQPPAFAPHSSNPNPTNPLLRRLPATPPTTASATSTGSYSSSVTGSPLPERRPASAPRTVLVAEKWLVLEKIGEGSFGQVFSGEDRDTRDRVAIKRERTDCRTPQLQNEFAIYKKLQDAEGFPKVFFGGVEDVYNVLVMEQLGPSLKELQAASPSLSLPLRTVVYCIPQMLQCLETLHKRGYIFRDAKPGQFCVGRYGDDLAAHPRIYLIDLGLAVSYLDNQGKHLPTCRPDGRRHKTGTARYASLNVHRGYDHSRRDDIESLAYLVIELVRGTLPWSKLRALSSAEGWRRTKEYKYEMTEWEIASGLPEEFAKLLKYARELSYAQTPDYRMLERWFTELGARLGDPRDKLVWHCPDPSLPADGGWSTTI
ncbi:hypothetical protein HDU89_006928 [Geranomyces variabilis]|nr:hypothetical protein HDU89_006928 [Geranomyces variabilis]